MAVVAGIGLVVAGVGVAALNETTAGAAQATSVLSGFDPANIIDDAVMFNGSTMTAAEIQAFLNQQQPSCASGATCLKSVSVDIPALAANPMCAAMPAKSNQSAAQVIVAVAGACDVNPQVILVMLQKEQTLITGRTPYSGESVSTIYRKATGLGCPDTAACDPAKYGLFNQLYGVAYWLVRYTMPPGTGSGTPYSSQYTWFPVGKPNGVLYNPSAACGAGTITIKNAATASLYYYTPYQPNSAALAAGWGIGNSCSAYGNRNFYLYFTTWFGSTHLLVTGAIRTFWAAHTRALGNPTANAVSISANGGGTAQTFQKGMITVSATGSSGVTGSGLTEYTALGGPAGSLGWPRRAAATRTGSHAGTAQAFQNGTIYTSSAGAAAVLAPVYAKFMASGYETGRLGYPTGDAVQSSAAGGASWQAFQGGRIVVAGSTSTVVSGSMLAIWLKRNGGDGSMGWPTADAQTVTAQGRTGTLQTFQTGVAVDQGALRTVTGPIGKTYMYHRGPSGVLGWPTSVANGSTANGGGWAQRFSGGTIFWSGSAGTHALARGKVLDLYNARGGVNGTLGWMSASGNDHHGIGGTYAVFMNGRIYASSAGTDAVLGAILERYLAKGGTKGTLGWPTSNARSVHGAVVQIFQHGRISWTQSGGAKASRS
jgi:hypothetical protein